ncbi:MAG: S1/P1 nuclease [Bacteriovoracaceae bacterium]
MKKIILIFLFLISSSKILAWGPEGHVIIAQIAEDNLTNEAKVKIKNLLGQKTSLPSIANWADSIKGQREWSHTKSWHFVDIPDGQNYEDIPHSPTGDAVMAITDQVQVIKDPKSNQVAKQNALKFIVHFVGDIHQPLHVGRPSDRGGNDIQVLFNGRNQNLHAVWDSGLINHRPLSLNEYIRFLEFQNFLDPAYDIPELSFSQIIAEDMGARMSIYNFESNDEQVIILSQNYIDENSAIVNQRLLLGGKRLASLLNSVFR